MPALHRLVRRGRVRELRHTQRGWNEWQVSVLDLLGIAADRLHARAPVEWLGMGGDPRPGSWLLAEFVHLEMGSHSARLQRIESLEPEESLELYTALTSNLEFPGITVMIPSGRSATTQLFIHSAGNVDAECMPADFDAQAELRDELPQGRDGPLLRRWLTEAQMTLHELPVNSGRERRGLPSVNALWLSGLGEYDGPRSPLAGSIASADIYVKGLCRLHGTPVQRVPATAEAALATPGSGLVTLAIPQRDDPARALRQLEVDWFAPLVDAVGGGQLPAVEVILDHHVVWIDRAGWRRFWKRGPSLAALLQ